MSALFIYRIVIFLDLSYKMVILNLVKNRESIPFYKITNSFVFYGNKLALLVPMLCFFKGYISAESIPVLCLL